MLIIIILLFDFYLYNSWLYLTQYVFNGDFTNKVLCGCLFLFDVVEFRLPHDEDYWIIERSNSNHVFVRAEEVMAIGFDEDLG